MALLHSKRKTSLSSPVAHTNFTVPAASPPASLVSALASNELTYSIQWAWVRAATPASSLILISSSVMESKISSKNSRGRSLSLLIPRLILTNSSFVIFLFTESLCWSVFSITMAYESTCAASAEHSRPPLFCVCAKYLLEKLSMIRSIFWDSPGSRKDSRYTRIASTKRAFSKLKVSVYSARTSTENSSGSPSTTPTWALSRPGVNLRKCATCRASLHSAASTSGGYFCMSSQTRLPEPLCMVSLNAVMQGRVDSFWCLDSLSLLASAAV
mmetsp:Transcript_8359/g.25120  ORF Transcript_8359/g.25120 Transcript_8359/m.25120 type:complete len:271 (-) Transcript_8359:1603-2415(-)